MSTEIREEPLFALRQDGGRIRAGPTRDADLQPCHKGGLARGEAIRVQHLPATRSTDLRRYKDASDIRGNGFCGEMQRL